MSHETTIRLSEIENIVGSKEAGSDMDQIARIIDDSRQDFLVWSGNDNETFYIMGMGGYGVVSVASHLIGTQIKQMMGLLLEGFRVPSKTVLSITNFACKLQALFESQLKVTLTRARPANTKQSEIVKVG